MNFKRDQVLVIPELAAHLGLTCSEFIVEQVLKGGMGECARIAQGKSAYALKIIQSQFIEDTESWQRYLREVKLWVTLSACDGVAEALCATRINELPAVCSHWMNGGSLRQHLRVNSPEFFFSVIARIVGTLAWAHSTHGVIHRDLKPDNILLDDTLRAYVSDWGLARPLAAGDSDCNPEHPTHGDINLTDAGSHIGTILYSSPEQILGRVDLDHRTDIYSLGILMYEWEAGRYPFYGQTAQEVALKHLFEQPKKLRNSFGKMKFGVEDIIFACLQKDAANRPNYEALDATLEHAATRRGVRYERYEPALRYKMPFVGAGQFQQQMRTTPNAVRSADLKCAIVDRAEIDQYLREADALISTGEYKKAEEIYKRLFVRNLVVGAPEYEFSQTITVNYALCLNELGRSAEAIEVLDALSGAKNKPVAYYINLSLAQIRQGAYASAIETATEGLLRRPTDPDLLGNLLAAQTAAGAYSQAAETARTRLAQTRDVHSLHEVSLLHSMYADSIAEMDWPLAFKNYRHAVELLREAKNLNSRYLRVRVQLANVLEQMGAYATCSDEIATTHELPMHNVDRLRMVYLQARCMDRTSAYQPCREFCDRWLNRIAEVEQASPVPRWCKVGLERVRAVTISDGICIGNMAGGARVTSSPTIEFFADIVREPELREASDFCYLARWHEWIGSVDDAYKVLKNAEALYPDYWAIPFRRAEFQLRAGCPDSAVESADRATKLAPWRPQPWHMLAEALHEAGKSGAESARQHAEKVRTVRNELCEAFEKEQLPV
ncbi:MAG: protein kinase [Acidobacteriaceae bacterium]|nr:protein kinase [Acidobacteriaceae bacterium]